MLIRRLTYVLPAVLDRVPPEPISGPIGGYADGALSSLHGVLNSLAMITHLQQLTLSNTLGGIVLLVLLRLILRKAWITIAAAFGILFFASLTQMSDPLIGVPINLISTGIFLGVLVRFGVLASSMVVMPGFLDAMAMPTLDFSSWYAGRSMLFVLMLAAILVYAFYISLGSGLALRHSREQRG